MAVHVEKINGQKVALFKVFDKANGLLINTTPAGVAPVKQDWKVDAGQTITFHWPSSEHAYHAQKIMHLISQLALGQDKQKQQLIGFLRKLEQTKASAGESFNPRKDWAPMLKDFIDQHQPFTLKDGSTVKTTGEFNTKCYEKGTDDGRPYTVDFMRKVIRLKLEQNKEALEMALECARDGIIPIEVSQHDKTWASGKDGSGENWLGLVILEQANQLQSETVGPAIKNPWQKYQEFREKLNTGTPLSHDVLVTKVNSSVRKHSIHQATQWGAPGKKTISIAETRHQDPFLAGHIETAVKTELQRVGYRVDNGNNLKLVHEEKGISHDFSEPQKQKVEMDPGCDAEDVVRELIKVRAAIDRAKRGISGGQKLEFTSFKCILIDGKEVEAGIIKKVAFEFYNSVTVGGVRSTAGKTEAEDSSPVGPGKRKRKEEGLTDTSGDDDGYDSSGDDSDVSDSDGVMPPGKSNSNSKRKNKKRSRSLSAEVPRNNMLFNEMQEDVKTKRCELASQLNMSAKEMLDAGGGEDNLREFIEKNMLARDMDNLKALATRHGLLQGWRDDKSLGENCKAVLDLIVDKGVPGLPSQSVTALYDEVKGFLVSRDVEVNDTVALIDAVHQQHPGSKNRSELIRFKKDTSFDKENWMEVQELHVFAKLLNVRFELTTEGVGVSHYGDVNAAVIKMTHTSGAEGGHYFLSGNNTASDGRCGWTGILQGLVAIPESSPEDCRALTPLAQDLIRKTNACRDELTPNKKGNMHQWRAVGKNVISSSSSGDDEDDRLGPGMKH